MPDNLVIYTYPKTSPMKYPPYSVPDKKEQSNDLQVYFLATFVFTSL